jgi:hypothetical protein
MIRVRPALLEDLEAINAVWVRNGMFSFNPDDTRHWWLSHPFREEFKGVPIGWVLESSHSEVVGTFTNVHMMYDLEGRRFKGAIAGSWAVDTKHRNSSLMLAMAYFSQQRIDVCINGSASRVASRLMPVFKALRIPSDDYDLSYFWITNRRAFAASALRWKKIPLAGTLSPLVALGLWGRDLRCTGRRRSAADVRQFTEFGVEFDRFWEKVRQGPRRLRAVRTAAVLDWRFGSALRNKRATVLGLIHGDEMLGYVVLRENVREHLSLRQFIIADLQALEDSPTVLLGLIDAAREATRQANMDALEWQGWSSQKRRVAQSLRPLTHRYPVWPLFYKALNPELATPLSRPDTWDFSPFDAF